MTKRIIFSSLVLIFALLALTCLQIYKIAKPFLPHLNYLLGVDKPTEYLILLGNDTEARANGGFTGSYAKITLNSQSVIPDLIRNPFKLVPIYIDSRLRGNDKLSINSNFSFQDIYVPNGQLSGYVKPPEPIQQAFGHGTWELANADWDPNFPTTATTIRWFLEKGKETNPDILAVLNLSTIKKLLHILGPFSVSEYKATITPDNLYLFLQGRSELNFFPGSTQKKDALHAVGTSAFKKLSSLSLLKKVQIAQILFTDLKNQNIVLHSANQTFQKFLELQNFAGEYKPSSFDHFGLVEVNLGANKANSYVTRHTTHTITIDSPLSKGETPPLAGRGIKHQVQINFQNSSPEANPNPPLHYGGHYIAYLRIYLPANATNIEINHSEIATTSAGFSSDILSHQSPSTIHDLPPARPAGGSMISYGFWHLTLSGNTSQINLSYTLPLQNQKDYSLTLLKQNGFPTSPQTLNLFGKTLTTSLESNFMIKSL